VRLGEPKRWTSRTAPFWTDHRSGGLDSAPVPSHAHRQSSTGFRHSSLLTGTRHRLMEGLLSSCVRHTLQGLYEICSFSPKTSASRVAHPNHRILIGYSPSAQLAAIYHYNHDIYLFRYISWTSKNSDNAFSTARIWSCLLLLVRECRLFESWPPVRIVSRRS